MGDHGARVVLAGDMDGDGLRDLVVANHDQRTLSVLLTRTLDLFDEPFQTKICTEAEFFSLSVPTRGGSRKRVLKYVVPADPDNPALLPAVFQNVRLQPLHQEFLAETFPELFPALNRESYDALVHRRATRGSN